MGKSTCSVSWSVFFGEMKLIEWLYGRKRDLLEQLTDCGTASSTTAVSRWKGQESVVICGCRLDASGGLQGH